MAISKEKKAELVAQYTEQLRQSRGLVLVDYRGLGVGDMSGVRKAMRPIKAKFQVVKNRLLALALKEVGMSVPQEWLLGPTAVGFCYEDVPPVAKVLVNTAKDLELLTIKGGLLGGSVVSADEVHAIAELPPREALLAQVLGAINAPASQVGGAVVSGIRQVLSVLQAYVDELRDMGSGAESGLERAAEAA